MIIKWVDIKKEQLDKANCFNCKKEIKGKAKIIDIKYVGFGNGDNDEIILCKNCIKQENGENHIKYAERILKMLENIKHIIVARDKETGEQRQFIFYGDWYNEPSGLLVEEIYRPMTNVEKEIADILTDKIK